MPENESEYIQTLINLVLKPELEELYETNPHHTDRAENAYYEGLCRAEELLEDYARALR